LKLEKGSITFLFGPSGSGKSTLLNCISGILGIDSGSIEYKSNQSNRDLSLSSTDFSKIYPAITSVSQNYSLWPHLTNHQNITLSKKIDDKIDFLSFAKDLKIDNILDKYPYECSGGEQQRVAFLRHIALNPKLLILDEVTSALDVEQIEILSNILLKLKKKGMTILIVTHLLSFVRNIGDYFYFMDKGKIIEQGTQSDFRNPKTERLQKFLSLYRIE